TSGPRWTQNQIPPLETLKPSPGEITGHVDKRLHGRCSAGDRTSGFMAGARQAIGQAASWQVLGRRLDKRLHGRCSAGDGVRVSLDKRLHGRCSAGDEVWVSSLPPCPALL
ncbi:hypothetical protein RRG08_060896, partial [Elysia crispata]